MVSPLSDELVLTLGRFPFICQRECQSPNRLVASSHGDSFNRFFSRCFEANGLKAPLSLGAHESKGGRMSVAKVSEITASSAQSFEDAIQQGINRATKTLENVQSAWIQDQEVMVEAAKITQYKVRMKVTFVLND
jgi:flavin-binding protein dodecin